jgi:hypothetical protein
MESGLTLYGAHLVMTSSTFHSHRSVLRMLAINARLWCLSAPSSLIAWASGTPQLAKAKIQ